MRLEKGQPLGLKCLAGGFTAAPLFFVEIVRVTTGTSVGFGRCPGKIDWEELGSEGALELRITGGADPNTFFWNLEASFRVLSKRVFAGPFPVNVSLVYVEMHLEFVQLTHTLLRR